MTFIPSGEADNTKSALVPFAEKLNDANYNTWKHQAWLIIQTLGMKDHLDGSIAPPQFEQSSKSTTDTAAKVTEPSTTTSTPETLQESEKYKEWGQIDFSSHHLPPCF
ncbi:uncharacterized protein DS421_7g217150 [Arachis hypogaea]|nr:uncharacterized protein DS421_7g217150 [Arachis hypogaea]